MDEKKYQIFVSSTYEDLTKARERIIETILKLYHFPLGMEMFSAADDEQWEIIKDTINITDYYVVIIGHRYGSTTSEGISYTEKEYDYAKSQNIPILAFIRKRDVATKPHERDDNPTSTHKLTKFIDKATESRMCEYWENEDDLSTKIAIALPKMFRKNPRVGWVRADKAISAEVSEELAKLSSENRSLRIEKEQLKALIEDKIPNILIDLNDSKELEFVFTKNENLEIIFHKNKLPFSIVGYPETISIESIPEHLKPFLSSYEVEQYNESLPTTEEVDEYNNKREIYYRIKGTSIDLNINIANVGVSKANEVFIDIEFPKEILVIDKYDIKEYKHPDSPIPKNPLRIADEEYKKAQKRKINPLFDLEHNYHIPSFSPHLSIPRINGSKEIQTDLNKDENKITIRLKSLLHTRKVQIDDYAVIPIKTGQFQIKISVICEEYSESRNFVFPFKVKDESSNL